MIKTNVKGGMTIYMFDIMESFILWVYSIEIILYKFGLEPFCNSFFKWPDYYRIKH